MLAEVLQRHPSFADGSRIGNLDETSSSTVQNTRKILSPKGVKQIHKIKTAERGISVTTCCIVMAYGMVLPPVMIFPRKKFVNHMLTNCFPGTLCFIAMDSARHRRRSSSSPRGDYHGRARRSCSQGALRDHRRRSRSPFSRHHGLTRSISRAPRESSASRSPCSLIDHGLLTRRRSSSSRAPSRARRTSLSPWRRDEGIAGLSKCSELPGHNLL